MYDDAMARSSILGLMPLDKLFDVKFADHDRHEPRCALFVQDTLEVESGV